MDASTATFASPPAAMMMKKKDTNVALQTLIVNGVDVSTSSLATTHLSVWIHPDRVYIAASTNANASANADAEVGIPIVSIEYPEIVMHAISRSSSTTSSSTQNMTSLYCQMTNISPMTLPSENTPLQTVLQSIMKASIHVDDDEGVSDNNGEEDDHHLHNDMDVDVDDINRIEIHFVPRNPLDVEHLFRSMSECAALHPDPPTPGGSDDMDDDDENGVSLSMDDDDDQVEEDNHFNNAFFDAMKKPSKKQKKILSHLDSVFVHPLPGQFDDPE